MQPKSFLPSIHHGGSGDKATRVNVPLPSLPYRLGKPGPVGCLDEWHLVWTANCRLETVKQKWTGTAEELCGTRQNLMLAEQFLLSSLPFVAPAERTAGLGNSASRSVPITPVLLYRNFWCPGDCHATGGASQQADEPAEALVNTAKPGSQADFCMSCMFGGLCKFCFKCGRMLVCHVCLRAVNRAACLSSWPGTRELSVRNIPCKAWGGGCRESARCV